MILITLFIFIVIFTSWVYWTNKTIEVSYHNIDSDKIPETFEGYKIAHISDFHNKEWNGKLVELIKKENVDLILISGDIINDYKPSLEVIDRFIGDIAKIADIYYVTGNHEARSDHYDDIVEILNKYEVNILSNESHKIYIEQEYIVINGIDDPCMNTKEVYCNDENQYQTRIKITENNIKELNLNSEDYNILLSHRPEHYETYLKYDLDLTLCGHAHGGQIIIPIIGSLFAPNQGWFPKYTSGLYSDDDKHMIVSRGLGDSVIPIRFNNLFELVIIELGKGN